MPGLDRRVNLAFDGSSELFQGLLEGGAESAKIHFQGEGNPFAVFLVSQHPEVDRGLHGAFADFVHGDLVSSGYWNPGKIVRKAPSE